MITLNKTIQGKNITGATTNLQIVLKTQKSSYLNQATQMYGAVRKSYSLKFSCIKHLVFRFEMFFNQPKQRWWLVFSWFRFKGLYWIIIDNYN